MKIAYVVPYVPNLIRIRSYKLIEHLAKLGVEVSLFTVGSSKSDLKDANLLRPICRDVFYSGQPTWRSLLNCAAALPTRKAFQSVYSWSPEIGERLKRQIEAAPSEQRYDLVHVEHLRGVQYAEYVRNHFPDMPLLWDSVDCISHLFKQAANQSRGLFGRLISQLDRRRTQFVEGRQVCRVDHVLVTSPVDRDALLALAPLDSAPAPISILSNGVDIDYYCGPDNSKKEPDTIVFSGKMSYHANITMASYLIEEIMPKVWKERPAVRVVIVGKDPSPKIRKFAENPKVIVTGTVDDIRPYLWNATVSVVPLIYGAGIQNKILEAMAAGTPVVATSKSLPALRVVAGRDLLVADSPEELAGQILRLLTDSHLCNDINNNGLEYVAKYHDWNNIAKQLIEIYQQTVDLKNSPKNRVKML